MSIRQVRGRKMIYNYHLFISLTQQEATDQKTEVLSKSGDNFEPQAQLRKKKGKKGEREKKKEREMGEGGGGKKREKVQMIDNGSVINKIENLCFR